MFRTAIASILGWSLALPLHAAPSETSLENTFELGKPHSDEVDVELAKASVAFDEGRFEDAIAAFEAAYELEPDPSFLYNIGRVYEELGELRAAIDHYGRFATQPSVNIELRRQALERMQVLAAIVAATAPAEPQPSARVEPPEPVVPEPQVTSVTAPPVDARSPGNGPALAVSGFTLLGLGMAGLTVGGVFAGLTRRDAARLDGEDDPLARSELVRRGERRAAVADGLLIGGAVVATLGLVLGTIGVVRTRKSRATAQLGGVRLSF